MTQAITARMVSSTTEPATSGIGWSHGMACQVSLPSISLLRPGMNRRTAASSLRAGSWWEFLRHDGIEEVRIDCLIGIRRYILALPGKRDVTFAIQHGSALPHAGNPLRKGFLRHGAHKEVHAGKSVSAEL